MYSNRPRPPFPTTPASRVLGNILFVAYWVVMGLLGWAVYMQY